MGNFLKYEISTEPEGPQTTDYARKAALPALLRILVMMVDPACRADNQQLYASMRNLWAWENYSKPTLAAKKGITTISYSYLL
jgi:hypothetical protein